MNELLEAFPTLAAWIIAGLMSLLLTVLIYFLKQNITALKEVSSVVSEMRISFALQKKEIESTVKDLFKLESRVENVSKEVNSIRMAVNNIQNELNHNK